MYRKVLRWGKVRNGTGDFSRAFAAAREAAVEVGLANLTTTYVNCYACEGNKSVAYELYEQMDVVPDWVVVPVGSGPLLFGVWKGFEELRQFGLVDRTPRLMAVQPDGCAPRAEREPESAADGAELVRAIRRDVGDYG